MINWIYKELHNLELELEEIEAVVDYLPQVTD